jgi:hypothetical protein
MVLSADDYNVDIKTSVESFKNIAFKNKLLLSNFLTSNKFTYNGKEYSVNSWVENKISLAENNLNDDYVYWNEGGNSWEKWNTGDTILKAEEEISMIPSSYDIHYIYTSSFREVEEKIKELYTYVLELQEILISQFNIKTKIITTKFLVTIDTSINDYKFDIPYEATFFKDPTFNIKLVFDTEAVKGGARIHTHHKKHNIQSSKKYLATLLRTFNVKKLTELTEQDKANLITTNYASFDSKPVLSFDIKYFHIVKKNQALTEKSTLNLKLFKSKYIQVNSGKINTLTNLGLLTFSYLTTTNRNDEMGLNVDKYRQDAFIKTEFKENREQIAKFFYTLLEVYKVLFIDRKEFNIFFVEKIESLISNNKVNAYSEFIDFVERWVVSKFRPCINSFIKEFNSELTPYGIKLFVAGGDAMRRYDDSITVTKDIDTKLYITGAEITAGLSKEDFKKNVVELIVKHIVKLRNYMQENLASILSEHSMLKKHITYAENDYKFEFTLLTNDDKNNDQVRTREILKNENFPVDLYSIDYRAKLTVTSIKKDDKKPISVTKNFDISLLDVVLQDNPEDIFSPDYCMEFDGIPVASLDFLLKDFNTTYSIEDRALARISSSKYLKDISRHKQLVDIYTKANNMSAELGKPIDSSFFVSSDEEILSNGSLEEYKNILITLLKKNKFNIDYGKLVLTIFKFYNENNKIYTFDLLIIKTVLKYVERSILQLTIDEIDDTTTLDNFKKIKDILLFLKSKATENLNEIADATYVSYDYESNQDKIIKHYYHIFSAVINQNDGLQKHYMPYFRNKVTSYLNSLVPKSVYAQPVKASASRGAPKSAAKQPVVKAVKSLKRKKDSSSSSSDSPQLVLVASRTARGRTTKKPVNYVP